MKINKKEIEQRWQARKKRIEEKKIERSEKRYNKRLMQKIRQKPKKEFNAKYWVFYAPIVAIILVAVIYAVFLSNLWSNPSAYSNSIKSATESSFIGTGIAVISMALAVWAGLNIVNAIERKEFESFNKKVAEITKKELDVTLYERDKESFCQELNKTNEDLISSYFYKKFTNDDTRVYPFDKFFAIEQLFSQVYFLHRSEKNYDEDLISKANHGIQIIFSIVNNYEERDLAYIYLRYRMIEFDYYKGYCDKTPESRFNCLRTAAKGYLDISPFFEVKPPVFSIATYKEVPVVAPSQFHMDLAVYLLNSIGESYSKIMQLKDALAEDPTPSISEEMILEYAKRALFYLKCATYWNDNNGRIISQKEVYYRNYAIALENYERHFAKMGDLSEKIIYYYQRALKLVFDYNEPNNNRIGYILRSLMFYLNKYLNNKLNIKNSYEKEEQFHDFISNLQSANEDNVSLIKSFYELTVMSFYNVKLKPYIYTMHGFALRDIILLKYAQNQPINVWFEDNIETYIHKYKNVLYMINYLEFSDTFSDYLRDFDKTLTIYISIDK